MYNMYPNVSLGWWQRQNHSPISSDLLNKLYSWNPGAAFVQWPKKGRTTGGIELLFKFVHWLCFLPLLWSQMFLAPLCKIVSQNNFLSRGLYLCSLQWSKRIFFQRLPLSWTFCLPEIELGSRQLILCFVSCPSREERAAATESYIRPSTWGVVPSRSRNAPGRASQLSPCSAVPTMWATQSGSFNLLLFLLQPWLLFY